MNIAVRDADVRPLGASGSLTVAEQPRIETLDDVAAAEQPWRWLEAERAVGTAFQRYDFVEAWQRRVGAVAGLRPLIVLGFDAAGDPSFLLPFVFRPGRPIVIAAFPGGAHANFNMGLWRADALGMDAAQLSHTLRRAAQGRGIDLYALLRQPHGWRGVSNPLARLPRQPSVDDVFGLTLPAGGGEDALKAVLSSSMRKRLRYRERKLESLGGYRYLRASTPAEVARVLAAFFTQKAAHLAAQGLRDPFGDPGIPEFIRDACLNGLARGAPTIELHAIEGGGEVLAMMSGVVDDHRFSCMFNSYTLGDNGRWSPGLVLLNHVIPYCAARGLVGFDLGPGRAEYKDVFCREIEGLFDSFLAVTWSGLAVASALGAVSAAKRRIKASPPLWGRIQTLRRRIYGHAASGCGSAAGARSSTSESP